MTAAEWRACGDPAAMIRFASNNDSIRKERLFAVVCCRRVGRLLCDGGHELIARVERSADRPLALPQINELMGDIGRLFRSRIGSPLELARMYAVNAIYCAADCDNAIGAAHSAANGLFVASLDPASFHALRHTFVSSLAASGAGAKELQTLARHRDSRLTLNVYSHARPEALVAAVARLQIPGAAPAARPFPHLDYDGLERLALCVMLGTLLDAGGGSGAPRGAQDAGARRDLGGHLDTTAHAG